LAEAARLGRAVRGRATATTRKSPGEPWRLRRGACPRRRTPAPLGQRQVTLSFLRQPPRAAVCPGPRTEERGDAGL